MTFFSFQIVIEKEADEKSYFAYSPSLPGCFSNGKTIEQARTNMREAVEQHISSLLKHKKKIPYNDNLVHVEELSIGVPA